MKTRIVVLLVIFSMSMLVVGALGVLASEQNQAALAQTAVIQPTNQIGGSAEAVTQSGNYAYAGRGPRLIVYNAQNAAQPVYVAQSEILTDRISYLTVNGSYLYAAAGSNIAIFNIQNPATPTLVNYHATPARVDAIAIRGNYAFVVQTGAFDAGSYPGSGLYVYNITDPANLSQEANLVYDQYTDFNIVANGNYAYIAADNRGLSAARLLVIDISNPTTPVERNNIPRGADIRNKTGLVISGTTLYVGGYDNITPTNGFITYDITQPVTPTMQSFHTGNFLPRSITITGNIAYIAGSTGGLQNFNVTSPGPPADISAYFAPSPAEAVDVTLIDDSAYTAYSSVGLHVVSISDPHNLITTTVINPLGVANGVAVDNNYIYAADIHEGLRIFNKLNLSETGFLPANANFNQVEAQGDYVYVNSSTLSELRIIDVSNSTAPYQTSVYTPPGLIKRFYVLGNYIYIANDSAGLRIVDISNPASPSEAGSFTGGISNAEDVSVSGNYAYLADLSNGLRIIDVSDPSSLNTHTLLSLSGATHSVSVAGNYAYVATGDTILHVIDVSTPLSPSEVHSQTMAANVNTIQAEGDRLYAGTSKGEMIVFDISAPAAPVKISETTLPDSIVQFAIDGPTAYVADSRAGLYVFGAESSNQVYLPVIVK
ncbi:MAG TPA: hypothetical protein ENJ93_10460 [Chloroflexi bacterium]|nr:hypothetical protein [Chloroflexota bacterium]